MIGEVHSTHPVLMVFQTPTRRQRMARRRRYVLAGVVGLAVASGVVGMLSKPQDAGPHSVALAYLPPQ